jgi:hypothetical protein
VAGGVVIAGTLVLLPMPDLLHAGARALAVATHLKEPAPAPSSSRALAPPLAFRAGGMLLGAALLIGLGAAARRTRTGCSPRWHASICCDGERRLNPTIDAGDACRRPRWFTRRPGPAALYIGGRVRGYMNRRTPTARATWQIPAERPPSKGAWCSTRSCRWRRRAGGVREALSYDLPYSVAGGVRSDGAADSSGASPDERARSCGARASRWCVLPSAGAAIRARASPDVSDWNMRVFECHPEASRLALDVPPGLDGALRSVASDAEPLGDARIVEDGATACRSRRRLAPGVPGAARLVRSVVAGRGRRQSRAASRARTGLYRAVAVPPGRHVIRFSYRPRDFFAGLSLSVRVALIGFIGFRSTGRPERAARLHPDRADDRPGDHRDRAGDRVHRVPQHAGARERGVGLSSMRSIAAAQWQFALTCGT